MIRIKRTFNLILTLAAMLTMAQTAMAAITGSGTADDPYLISSTEDWNTFANNVNNGTSYSGQTVKLNADISVTTMVGSWDNPFNGTFDGGGHTLNVTLNNDSQYGDEDAYYGVAPFRFTNGATFQFLVVTGIVTTSTRKYAAGLIGMTKGGTNTILNCISSVEIYSTINNKWGDNDGTHGGFIGKASGTVTINNSLFNGQLTTTSDNPTINCGGFVGWRDGSSTLSISNCLYAPNTTIPSGKTAVNVGATFSRNDVTPTNSYYTQTLGTAQGTAVGSKTATQLVAALGSAWRVSSGRAVPKLLLSSKSFTHSNIEAGSTNQLNYDGNLFISATGESTASKSTWNPYNITLRAPYNQEGTLRLYPRISGKVKSIVFSSAYTSTGNGYMKIGKSTTWTNSVSETMTGNNLWRSISFTNGDIQLDNEDDYLEIKIYDSQSNGSFFSKGSITITYEPTEATDSHRHNFSYNAVGNTLTATCAHNDGKDCSLASDNWQISTTLTPPTFPAYGQYVYHPATLSNIAGFTAETGATAGAITYVNNTTSESLGTSSPHDIGAYTASVTINADNYPYTLTTSYNVGTFCGINTNYPQFTTDKEGNYALDGETVTLTFTSLYGETLTAVTATGATSGNDITLTSTGANTYTFTMPQEEVNIGATFSAPDASNFEQNGDTYTIKTANGWGWFCFVTNYNLAPDGFSGKVVKLAGNVSSSEMAGTFGHPFKGTFDGQGNTLTFNRTAAEEFCAPFHYINGATISNLHVGGTITGGNYENLGGLVGHSEGNITIENCRVSTEISTTVSGGASHGGVIAQWNGTDATCTVTGCVYDGLIYNPNYSGTTYGCGGFVGCLSDYVYVELTDCLFIEGQYDNNGGKHELLWGHDNNMNSTFLHRSNDYGEGTLKNCFYVGTRGLKQGSPAVESTTAPTNFAHLGAPTNHCFMQTYGRLIVFNNKYYTPTYGDMVETYDFRGVKSYNIEYDDKPLGIPDITTQLRVPLLRYKRTFTNGKPVTVMMPFNFTKSAFKKSGSSDGLTGHFYEFKGIHLDPQTSKWTAEMNEVGSDDANEVTTMTANTPYLYVPDEEPQYWYIDNGGVGVNIFTEGYDGGNKVTPYDGSNESFRWNKWDFIGTYQPRYWSETEHFDEVGKVYGFAGNTKDVDGKRVVAGDFVRVKSGAKIRPTSCYLMWTGSEPSNARALTRGAAATEELPQSITVKLISASGETTAIGTLDTKTGEMTFDSEAWYTLDGIRLSGKPSSKGIYINNGKKIVIK